eukprot:CAMPEP_0204825138 /NCGR_PEP_ID=MMETSP1346-20131115/3074_1 /ASSEMBLY_ACC=CAM_ASM_000771 /TAXON_ID=215587 /ORGANISM="Aplanochytrium stocchinoi, Strain GSBS06" /LENGTH=246 /DNA_ID=CAMNT_0051952645 /DNA_START=333 /DNA_END=1070 /DNA_ORIENTATION=+
MADLLKEMGLAASAAVIVVNFTHPIETIKTNMQLNSNFSMRGFFQAEGASALYKGIGAGYMREAFYTSVKLGLYGPIKKAFGAGDKDAPFVMKFAAGSTAGVLGSFLGNPWDLLKTVQQSSTQRLSLGQQIQIVYKEHGLTGFWRGIVANAVRACVLNGTKMACYDQIKGYTTDVTGWKRNELRTQFLSATATGFCMTCTVSPFDRVRSLMMTQGQGQGQGQGKTYSGFFDCFAQTIKNEGVLSLW